MEKECILVYDLGTTSLKVALFDRTLNLVDLESRDFHYDYLSEGRVEFDGDAYWDMVVQSTRALLARQVERTVEVVTLASQGETIVPVDETGRCVRKAIVWLDARASTESSFLSEWIDRRSFHAHTGIDGPSPILPVCKLLWLQKNEPENDRRTDKYLLLKDYIIFRLTGETVSDPTICACSGCFDTGKKVWWQEALGIAGIDSSKLCRVAMPDDEAGTVRRYAARLTGLREGTPVLAGMLDQCASAIGSGNFEPGTLTETTGTALVLAATVQENAALPPDTAVPFVCHAVPGMRLLLPYGPTGGMVLKWFRDAFCEPLADIAEALGKSIYQVMDDIAGADSARRTSLVLLPHFCGKVSPENQPGRKGLICGLGLDTGRAEIIRAILEGTAFLLKDNVDQLIRCGLAFSRVLSLGGGAASPLWMQIKSNVLNRRLETLDIPESTSAGCAAHAAVHCGYLPSLAEYRDKLTVKRTYTPEPGEIAFYQRKYDLYTRLDRLCL